MKIKFNWGTGIFIAIVLFMSFILYFFIRSFSPTLKHDLVSEDYYKDELHYQEEIDKLNNASKLAQNITISNSKNGLIIHFPKDLDPKNISGTIFFQRLSNKELDFQQDIVLIHSEVLIPDSRLVSGKWIVKIEWNSNNEEYLFKDNWFY